MKARPNDVNAAFLLFPTISNIGATPKGRLLTVRSLLSKSSLIKSYAVTANICANT